MHLRILHRTRYLYRSPVSQSQNEVRLHPVSDDPKRVEFFLLKVQPPARLRHFRDEFLNYVHWFEQTEPHTELVIEASMVVRTTSTYRDGLPYGVPMEALKAPVEEEISPFLAESRYIPLEPELWRLALDIRQEETDVFAVAQAIMRHIHENWEYAPNTTNAATTVTEVLHARKGVCQDLAQLMVGLCRSLRIPARYVSGYLYNGPGAHLRGAQASHAWCEVWLPGRGWHGLDPTNNILTDERHVKIATGCDYDDAAPVRGRFAGVINATSQLEVTVRVEEVSA